MATAAAAVVAKARRQIQHHFFSADAVRADRAVPFAPSNHAEARQFEKLEAAGVIHRVGGDRFWLDVVAYDLHLRARHTRVKWTLLALVAVLAVIIIVLEYKPG